MAQKKGQRTLILDNPPTIMAFAAIGSKKEAEGPMGGYFDYLDTDGTFGEKSWEKAESSMQKKAVEKALNKCSLSPSEIDFAFAGDLLNQCAGSTFGLRDMGIPLLGVYGACSTMAEGLLLASLFIEAGFGQYTLAATSSHFCSAERQFRFPLEYGGQRPPTAQWTATAAGSVVLGAGHAPPYVRAVTVGQIEDLGVKDANNMGAAMAPAAAGTLKRFFEDTNTNQDNYDLILTGDLGQIGSDLLMQLMKAEGYDLSSRHSDCGIMMYDRKSQPEVGAGGSGCGCSAAILCGYMLPKLKNEGISNLLFMATGALMSPTTTQQGETIPGIAHLVWISSNPS